MLPLGGQPVPLLELVKNTNSELQWNPYRKRGLITKGDQVFSFMTESDWMILNNKTVIPRISIKELGGTLYFSKESAAALYRYLKTDDEIIHADDELLPFSVPVIVIDPGHGGRDSGAIGRHKEADGSERVHYEKDLVLDTSRILVEMLRKKYPDRKILLTRNRDVFATLEERVEIANNIELNKKEAVIYISIHANASLNTKAEGFEVWYLPETYRRNVLDKEALKTGNLDSIINAIKEEEFSIESKLLASHILNNLHSGIGEVSSNRGLKEETWFVVRKARMASVLIEMGFITHKEESLRMSDPVYLKKIAEGIYNGINNFIEYYENSTRIDDVPDE